jgi:hypothetical protein
MKSLAKMSFAAALLASTAVQADSTNGNVAKNYDWNGFFNGTVELTKPFKLLKIITPFTDFSSAAAIVAEEQKAVDDLLAQSGNQLLNPPAASNIAPSYQGEKCWTVSLAGTLESESVKGLYELHLNAGTPHATIHSYEHSLIASPYVQPTEIEAVKDGLGTLAPRDPGYYYEPDLAQTVPFFIGLDYFTNDVKPTTGVFLIGYAGCSQDFNAVQAAAAEVNRASVEHYKAALDSMLKTYQRYNP